MTDLVILLSAAGRRPYLFEWFRYALIRNNIAGQVILADMDPLSPAAVFADVSVKAPPVISDGYEGWLRKTVRDHRVDLALSVNDFELSFWAHLLNPPQALMHLTKSVQEQVEDKYLMGAHLTRHKIRVPPTYSPTEILSLDVDSLDTREYVIKARYGSGSRGLRYSAPGDLRRQLSRAQEHLYGRDGQALDTDRPSDHLIVQPRISGTEFGLDVICDLNGDYVSVLARRKIAMRGGETDKAVTVDPRPFEVLARKISVAVPHEGMMDVDVIQDHLGETWVIDINPRFGGGYPFSHLSGTDIPSAYVAWLAGREPEPEWFVGDIGVASAKFVDLALLKRYP